MICDIHVFDHLKRLGLGSLRVTVVCGTQSRQRQGSECEEADNEVAIF